MIVNILMAWRNSSRMVPQLYKEGHPKVQLCDNMFAFSTALSPPKKLFFHSSYSCAQVARCDDARRAEALPRAFPKQQYLFLCRCQSVVAKHGVNNTQMNE
jgi:hypothetical protein